MAANTNFTADKNTIGTPQHIVQFLSELLDAQNHKVFDPTAGSGNMFAYSENISGIEYEEKPYRMLCDRFPDGHFICGSVFDNEEFIRTENPTLTLMNPPYNAPKSTMPESYRQKYGDKGEDSTKGLYFVRWTADIVGKGFLAAVLPVGVLKQNKAMKEQREALLKNHTLKSILFLPPELFKPVGIATLIMIFELGIPHNGKTFFADFCDDGMVWNKAKGRYDKDGKWNDIKAEWLRICNEQPVNLESGIRSNVLEITANEDWDKGVVLPIKTEPPTREDFYKTVKDYMDWRIGQVGLQQFLAEHPHLLPSKEERKKQLEIEIFRKIKELEAL